MKPKNNAPVLRFKQIFAPVLPYDLTAKPNNGFQVIKITGGKPVIIESRVRNPKTVLWSKTVRNARTLAYDEEQNEHGICVVSVSPSGRGSWEWQSPGGSWEKIVVKNRLINNLPENPVHGLCLNARNRLR